jgi:diguanylate cyclase (GGDEF)-like protein
MAMVEIPDEVFGALRAQARVRLKTDDPSPLLVQLARRYLADVCAPGFDRDTLTGSETRQGLRTRINRATWGSSWTDRTIYRERFLCIDLDDFKKYLDVHGLLDGDAVLRGLADRLQAHYGKLDVYRFGGDEFVVVLGDREPWLPELPSDVTLAHAIVDVALRRNQHRNHHVYNWIEMHLDAGVLASRSHGTRIQCGDPLWLDDA